jgi:regulator of protease activity HflC (stomatin/prohibitin superfamily)
MRAMVQQEADALGLGVEIVTFTIGGMHPPVTVASDYEDVVSAEISKATNVVNVQAYHDEVVPSTEAAVLKRANGARAEGASTLSRAAGEAWSFRTLQSQHRAEPRDYLFRRRLVTMENSLGTRHFTVVDSRFQRDGGELWLVPQIRSAGSELLSECWRLPPSRSTPRR